jgi:predicted DNA-binding transcriptional regulator AlpA
MRSAVAHVTQLPRSEAETIGGPAPATPRWLSVKEIAADLGISVSTAYKWSARGDPWFPRSIRLRNGDLRVRRDWYEVWLTGMET